MALIFFSVYLLCILLAMLVRRLFHIWRVLVIYFQIFCRNPYMNGLIPGKQAQLCQNRPCEYAAAVQGPNYDFYSDL